MEPTHPTGLCDRIAVVRGSFEALGRTKFSSHSEVRSSSLAPTEIRLNGSERSRLNSSLLVWG
jgi:hypothetical protein